VPEEGYHNYAAITPRRQLLQAWSAGADTERAKRVEVEACTTRLLEMSEPRLAEARKGEAGATASEPAQPPPKAGQAVNTRPTKPAPAGGGIRLRYKEQRKKYIVKP